MNHGLTPLLYRNVPDLRPALEERFQQNLKRSLLLTSELTRLLELLPTALVFKGPALAQRLYGDVAAREYCDLDLLLRPTDIPPAIAALEKAGFTAALPLQSWQLQRHLHDGCEYAMSKGPVHLELHWQFATRQFGAAFDIGQVFRRADTVRIGDRGASTLSPEDDFLMLVVHGTKHAWERLSWIADLAALLRVSSLDWDYLRVESKRMRICRMMRIALILAGWMGAAVPGDMQNEVEADSEAAAVAGQVRDHVAKLSEPGRADSTEHRLITATLDSPADRLAYAARYAITPSLADWDYLRLPRGARWLYPAVRLLRLATQR